MKSEYLYFANWKMNKSFKESLEFAKAQGESLATLAEREGVTFAIFPSYDALYPLAMVFQDTAIAIGAQDCSQFNKGSFTGDVSAQSLHEVGCTYCIIGHSERRTHYKETDKSIAAKFIHLIDFDINPIVCIGETLEEYKAGTTLEILTRQLAPIFELASSSALLQEYITVSIAYEPVWSIGTGKIATNEHLETVFVWLQSQLQKSPHSHNWRLIYGGSVNGENIEKLKNIDQIDGFLIGGASLDFSELKKIVD